MALERDDRGADRIDRVILSMPLLGDIRLKHQVASFSRMLSTLLQGGLPLVPAMETAGASMSSRRILKGVMRAGARVREGQGLARQPGRAEDFSGAGGGDDRSRRVHRERCRRC